ncbi:MULTISPECIES: ring-cleaving dioxygenase [unclassified Jeotgalibaca]|uniref:ring-cleaving dioxygenase n=1 Tax=unclassified Jeotgalibaca TaxID=2621505 RepID=UPI003FD42EBC
MKTQGIHHITAIVGNAQENVDFYAGILGLRLIKKTVNFDDPGTYHLYFGDQGGKPGTVITFFPWNKAHKGKIGGGQVGVTTYAVPTGALPFWERRLRKFDITFHKSTRFGETYLQFTDYHGLILEIVEREEGAPTEWTHGEVTPEVGIKGFGGAILFSTNPADTIRTVENVMGLEKVGEEGDIIRLRSSADIGNIVDIKQTTVPRGEMGVGTVHHIAWRANDRENLLEWQEHVRKNNHHVTEVKDRNYFNAIYYREKGEILFEIATDTPGFTADEAIAELGSAIKLPEQYETRREELTAGLQPIEVRNLD